jgi:hypothetical protein
MTIMTDHEQIKNYRLLTLRQGLRLEIRGLRKSGHSCYQIIKNEFGLKGTRKEVLAAFEKILNERGVTHA